MESTMSSAQQEPSGERSSVRLYYLDWLRVVATLGVFLFHAVHPFDFIDWEIKNVEQSMIVTMFIVFFAPWGMPFFFLMSGTGTWFSLRRRTAGRYITERVSRLLIPFVVGSLLLSPLQLFFQWSQRVQRGQFEGSLLEFLAHRKLVLGPMVFGWAGYHLWFLGFLIAFSLIALPLFLWLKRDTGQRFIAWLAQLSEKRGGILLFVLPLLAVQLLLRPLYLEEHDWADFAFMLVFFVSGYILIADERFARAIQRDWRLMLIGGIVSSLVYFAAGIAEVGFVWMSTPGTPGFYLIWGLWSLNSWCWALVMMKVGMRFLDFSSRLLQYGQEAIVPFFLFHQPVIIAIAFYVVQWQSSILVKLLVVVLSSFVATLGLYEFVVRRIGPLRALFGMKPPRPTRRGLLAG
jgi:glucan biosynthesis protein C